MLGDGWRVHLHQPGSKSISKIIPGALAGLCCLGRRRVRIRSAWIHPNSIAQHNPAVLQLVQWELIETNPNALNVSAQKRVEGTVVRQKRTAPRQTKVLLEIGRVVQEFVIPCS